jgi:Mg-chelatase subunit ChlD
MNILQPEWLLLLFPLWIFGQSRKMPTGPQRWLRGALLLALLLGLAGVAIEWESSAGMIVVVADRSRSMPAGSDDAVKELVKLMQRQQNEQQRLAVVPFGEQAGAVLLRPGETFPGFTDVMPGHGSDLAGGLERALSLVPQNTPARILIVSDGQWTGRSPVAEAYQAATRRISMDYRHQQRVLAGDLAVARVSPPVSVAPREEFILTAWIHSPVAQKVEFEFVRGDQVREKGAREVEAGLTRVVFRDRALTPGTLSYEVRVLGTVKDPVPENNRARCLIPCVGPKQVRLVSGAKESRFAELLAKTGLDLVVAPAKGSDWSVEALNDCSTVILENLPADHIGPHGMRNLAAWVRELGGGLVVTGGKRSFGAGGYYKSPLEPVLPVSMELRSEHRKLSLAIVVVLDRSGSMAMPVAGGKKKIDLANMATVQVLDLLNPMDEFGTIAVDSSAHTVLNLCSVDEAKARRNEILRIESMGGGIFVYEALAAAFNMLLKAKAQNRHIVLFADAADAEQPGEFRSLLNHCLDQNITVSVIGLGRENDSDAELLREVARRGRGQVYFSEDAHDLPRLFAQDTFVVARSTFIEGPAKVHATPGMMALLGTGYAFPLPIGGYNLCYLRNGAFLGAEAEDEFKGPLVAAWNAGLGKTACYLGEADGAFTGGIAQWDQLGAFFSSLVRWTGADEGALGSTAMATQKVENGLCTIELHLDPDRENNPFSVMPVVSSIVEAGMQEQPARKTEFSWKNADTLTAEIPLSGDEVLFHALKVGGKRVSLPPTCLPYSPEFTPAPVAEGRLALESLARISGGKERISPAEIWRDIPAHRQMVDISAGFFVLALLLLLLEVAERRLRAVSGLKWPFGRRTPNPATAAVTDASGLAAGLATGPAVGAVPRHEVTSEISVESWSGCPKDDPAARPGHAHGAQQSPIQSPFAHRPEITLSRFGMC